MDFKDFPIFNMALLGNLKDISVIPDQGCWKNSKIFVSEKTRQYVTRNSTINFLCPPLSIKGWHYTYSFL